MIHPVRKSIFEVLADRWEAEAASGTFARKSLIRKTMLSCARDLRTAVEACEALRAALAAETEREPSRGGVRLTPEQANALILWSREAQKPKGCSGYGSTFDAAMRVADELSGAFEPTPDVTEERR